MVMGGIFGTVADGQSSMFRLQQARKPWETAFESRDAKDQLARKAEKAQAIGSFSLTPDQERDRAAALTAMEEAKRVGGPKAAAAQRLEQVERKIEELKLSMRHAHGDRQKLAQLAREAAILAKEAGRAAKEYAVGVANAAEMGLGGGAGLASTTEITHTRTVTSLTVQQTEVTLELRVSLGDSGGGSGGGQTQPQPQPQLSPDQMAAAALADDQAALQGAAEDTTAEAGLPADAALPPEIADLVNGALAGLQAGGAGASGGIGGKARELMQRMLTENDLKMSRYKEADAFGRRVEAVLATARNIIGEAKAANILEESEERRKARRESFKEYDKIVAAAQKEVEGLRQAAFGSSIGVEDILDSLGDDGGGEAVASDIMPATTDAPASPAPTNLVDVRA